MPKINPLAAEGFSVKPSTYVQGRPDYPAEVEGWLRDDLGLRAGRTAVDLGAGTGKFTPRLRATGATVIAVEPVAAMRAELVALNPDVEALDGSATEIPLADASVDAVACAQAFHWFANPTALAEIRRVLKPGGVLGLIWNVRDARVPWVAVLNDILDRHEGDAPRYQDWEWKSLFPAEGYGPLREQRFSNGHRGTIENVIVDRVLSTSFIATLPPAEQNRVVADVRAVIDGTPEIAGKDEIVFPYETHLYSCTKL